MQAAGRASHRMRNTLICALPLAHQPAVVDAQIGGSWRVEVLGPGRYPWRIVVNGQTAGNS